MVIISRPLSIYRFSRSQNSILEVISESVPLWSRKKRPPLNNGHFLRFYFFCNVLGLLKINSASKFWIWSRSMPSKRKKILENNSVPNVVNFALRIITKLTSVFGFMTFTVTWSILKEFCLIQIQKGQWRVLRINFTLVNGYS